MRCVMSYRISHSPESEGGLLINFNASQHEVKKFPSHLRARVFRVRFAGTGWENYNVKTLWEAWPSSVSHFKMRKTYSLSTGFRRFRASALGASETGSDVR